MLFNSWPFLLGFLPLALGVYALAARSERFRLPTLLFLSVCFYGYWDWRFVPLLVGSVAVNYAAARAFYATRKSWIVVAAIALDLAVLGAFKYLDFALGTFTSILHLPTQRMGWVLPLGISFFTFHHIMYLTDLRRGKAPMLDPVRYGLYIAFFPQILSGPLVRYTEIVHQFDEPYWRPGLAEKIGRGFMFLGIGLAEKLLFADSFARIAEPIFHASQSAPVPLMDAWRGALAFGLQIFFDFGGYSNMAIGVGLMFGLLLPQNFDRPYRAASLQDFWRRWHMTLSRFLRDYLYIPLGGSRHGLPTQMWALIVTMVLGGLWHGAGWTFIIWGALHGFGQAVAVLWRRTGVTMPMAAGWLLTMLFVTVAWVFFRATSVHSAVNMLAGMAGVKGVGHGLHPVDWALIGAGGLVSTLVPAAWNLGATFKPRWTTALVLGGSLAALLVMLGQAVNYAFIYFQF